MNKNQDEEKQREFSPYGGDIGFNNFNGIANDQPIPCKMLHFIFVLFIS
jgi:hypothetical protein